MTKRNVLLGVCAAIGTGMVLCFVALYLTHFNYRNLLRFSINHEETHSKAKEGTYSITEPFSGIQVEVPSGDVRFIRSDDGASRVETFHGENAVERVEVKNGVLTIQREYKGVNVMIVDFSGSVRDNVTVYLNGDVYDTLLVTTASGDVDVPEWLTFSSVEMNGTSGDMECAAQCDELQIETVSGDIAVSDIHAERATIGTVSGGIILEDLRVDNELEMNSVSGDIELDRCDAGEIGIETTSGKVQGTLLTDKSFEVYSISGKINVPASVTDAGDCQITTVSGDVKLSIAS